MLRRWTAVILCLAVTVLLTTCALLPHRERSVIQTTEHVLVTIPVGHYPHGLAIDEQRGRVYVANMSDGTISIIDSATDRVIGAIPAGNGTRAVAIHTQTGCLYAANLGLYHMESLRTRLIRLYRPEFAVTVFDSAGGSATAHVKVGVNPWAIAVNQPTHHIYVANYNAHSVSVIDGSRNVVIATVDMGSFRIPYDIAVDERTNRVYVTNSFHIGPIDSGTGRLLVVDGDTHQVVETIRIGRRAHVAVNERTGHVYVTCPQRNVLTVIDGQTLEEIASLRVGTAPSGLAVDERANRIYVANGGGSSICVIDGDANEVLYEIGLSASPRFVAVDEASGKIYVTHPGEDLVSVLGRAASAG